METRKRTFVKTISWRIIATLITSVIVWKVTGKISLGVSIGLLDCLIKMVGYYAHERVWAGIKFGYQNRSVQTEKLEREFARHY